MIELIERVDKVSLYISFTVKWVGKTSLHITIYIENNQAQCTSKWYISNCAYRLHFVKYFTCCNISYKYESISAHIVSYHAYRISYDVDKWDYSFIVYLDFRIWRKLVMVMPPKLKCREWTFWLPHGIFPQFIWYSLLSLTWNWSFENGSQNKLGKNFIMVHFLDNPNHSSWSIHSNLLNDNRSRNSFFLCSYIEW